MTDEELKAAIEAALKNHGGNAAALAEKLYTDNFGLREKNRGLKDEVAQLKAKAPADGALVLSGDDTKAWDAYRKLGAPGDLATALDSSKSAAAELAAERRKTLLAEAAEAHGMKPAALRRLIGDTTEIELKDVDKDGKRTRQALVKDGDKSVPLDEYAEREWPEFMPALKADGKAAGTAERGTQYVAQTSGGKAPQTDPVEAFIEAQRKRAEAKASPLAQPNFKTGA